MQNNIMMEPEKTETKIVEREEKKRREEEAEEL